MDHVARIRQRVLAIFLPVAAVLYVSAEGLNPKGTDTLILTMADALKVLHIAATHPTQLYLSGSLTLLALGARGGLVCGDRHAGQRPRLRGRHGGCDARRHRCLLRCLVNVLVGVNLAAAATAHMTQDAAARSW